MGTWRDDTQLDTLPDNTHAQSRMVRWPAHVDAARRTSAGVTVESLPTLGALSGELRGDYTVKRYPRTLEQAFPWEQQIVEHYPAPSKWLRKVCRVVACLGACVLIGWLASKAV